MNKILIIGPAWVGDMIMAQSLLKLIKERQPETILHVAATSWAFPVLSRMPEIDGLTELPLAHGQLGLGIRYRIAKELRKQNFDQAIVLPNSFKSALIPWLAGIPKRTGWLGECRFGVLNDVRYLDEKRYPLMVERLLALGLAPKESLPAFYSYPQLSSTPETQALALQKLDITRPTTPVLALCAGAEFGPSKRWPAEYYAEVARQKLAANWQVWLFGSPKDRVITDRIMELTDNRCVHIAGRTQLDQTIDLIAMTSAVITNDSGLMHIAAALKKPIIAIYGSSSPGYTPPLARDVSILKLNLPCQPCFERECPLEHHQCLRDITPDLVLNALAELPV